MFYRLFVAAVIGFWLLMATLLVRTELFPDQDSERPVPVDYVEHLIFHHEQPSELVLFTQHRRLDGNFHLQPKRLPHGSDGQSAGTNLLSVSGNFPFNLPGATTQRVVFHGNLEFDDHHEVERVELSISLHEPKQNTPGITLHLDGRPRENQWHYLLAQGSTTLREGHGGSESILDGLDPHVYGFDPHVLLRNAPQGQVTVSAHRGTLRVNDEAVDTFVISIRQGENLETAIHVNQLGQVLAVKTFLDYDLYDEALVP